MTPTAQSREKKQESDTQMYPEKNAREETREMEAEVAVG